MNLNDDCQFCVHFETGYIDNCKIWGHCSHNIDPKVGQMSNVSMWQIHPEIKGYADQARAEAFRDVAKVLKYYELKNDLYVLNKSIHDFKEVTKEEK